MERDGTQIIFDADEQREFSLPPETTAADALAIAENFMEAAITLEQAVLDQRALGNTDHAIVQELNHKACRAGRLFAISRTILRNCEPELCARMLQDFEELE